MLPQTIIFALQPYGTVTLGELSLGSNNGYPCLHGIVTEGSETSYLCGHTSTRSVVGQPRTIYGIRQEEIAAGHAVRCYCG